MSKDNSVLLSEVKLSSFGETIPVDSVHHICTAKGWERYQDARKRALNGDLSFMRDMVGETVIIDERTAPGS